MDNETIKTIKEMQAIDELDNFITMIEFGFKPEDAAFALEYGQYYYLDGVPENAEDAAEWLFYHYNFYDDDSDAETDIPDIIAGIKCGDWIYKSDDKESIIISTW